MSNEQESDEPESNEQEGRQFRKVTPEEIEGLKARLGNSQPRPHHYVLGHVALRSLALENPLRFLSIMGTPDADKFLNAVYQNLVESLKDEGPPDFTLNDVRYDRGKLGDWLCVVFTLPPPKEVTEVYFCCLAGHLDQNDPNPTPESIKARWFTLEYGLTDDGGKRTVLCEWTKDGTHKNYGDGPEPTLDNFLQAVADKIVPSTH